MANHLCRHFLLAMLRNLLFTIFFITFSFALGSPNPTAAFTADELQNKPTPQLIKETLSYIGVDSMTPRMLAGCNIVYNRYLDSPQDKVVRHAAVDALQAMGNHYMCRDIDYRKAYKNLWLAKQIADEDQDYHSLASIYNSLANLYYFSNGTDKEKESKAVEMLTKAADAAIRSANEKVLAYITENIAIISATDLKWGVYSNIVPRLLDYRYHKFPALGKEAQGMLTGVKYLIDKQYAAAEKALLEVEQSTSPSGYSERTKYTLDLLLIKVYRNSNQLPKALSLIYAMLKDVKARDAIDYELSLYEHLTNIYGELGQKDSSDYYSHKLLALKEAMENDNGYKAVSEMDFVTEIERVNAEVEQLSIKRQTERRERVIIIACCVILTILLVSLLWVHLNLKRTHRRLYRQSEEQMHREQQHRLMREQSRQDTSGLTASESVTPVQPSDSEPDESTAVDSEQLEALQRVYTRILMVMEESREIYDNSFAISDLAALVRETQRTVSRAINICHKANFHGLLNEYRLREVIRLMHTPEASRLTIESLAEQAGFRSRTSFSSLFKRSTGLTPSEYMRMAVGKSKY